MKIRVGVEEVGMLGAEGLYNEEQVERERVSEINKQIDS